jgi:Glyoxalase/Bleomycin resistance protein/Dioxygenase superfamily
VDNPVTTMSSLGPIRQMAFVVADIEAAMFHWTSIMGIGPFFYIRKVPTESFRFRNASSPIELSIALSQSGPMQIELIQQRNAAPSLFGEFRQLGLEGLHHVAFWTSNFDEELKRFVARGFRVVQTAQSGPDGRNAFFDKEHHPGTVIELSETSGAKGRFFQYIASCAADWDGTDPIRSVNDLIDVDRA